jgi:uncharacterized protein YqgC (DUF456 family)
LGRVKGKDGSKKEEQVRACSKRFRYFCGFENPFLLTLSEDRSLLEVLGTIVLCLALIAGLMSIIFGFPGTAVIFFSALIYGLFSGFEKITGGMVIGLAILTVCGEGLEYVFGTIGARRFGSSKRGIIVSVIGGFIGAMMGAPFLFGIGAVVGALLGAFAGAICIELVTRGPHEWKEALRSGLGNFLGRIAGMLTKIALAIGMIVWILVSLF